MADLAAKVVLRPTRIGFLTSPTNLASVRTIMRISACLWGGGLNPIIPVFRRAPREWRPEIYERFKGAEVAKGYVRFFEPDVFVETEKGLLETVGLGALRPKLSLHRQVITLKEFLKSEQGRNWSEPAFGLNIADVLQHIYETEQRFVLRDKRESLRVLPNRTSAAVEAMFGVFPASRGTKYLEQLYRDVYQPVTTRSSVDIWRKVYLKGATTPLRVTTYGLEMERLWHHDLVIFVFDPERATDLIDLWNLRLEPRPVLPVPVDWFQTLADDIFKILKAEHRPVVGNPSGVMHNATIEFGRSILHGRAEKLIRSLKPGLPSGALVVKYWRNAIWAENRDDRAFRETRLRATAEERRISLPFEDGKTPRSSFDPLSPKFAARFSRSDFRWANVLKVSDYANETVATVLPFNTFDRSWPHLGLGAEAVPVGSEGWVFLQRYTNLGQFVSLLDSKDAIAGSLASLGINAKLSEPGHIARQMLEHLGGLSGVQLVADIETLKLLNNMAGGIRRKRNEDDTIEENFDLRSAPLKTWIDLISERRSRRPLLHGNLGNFTKRNVIRLGMETDCPHCSAKNWSSLTEVDYRLVCERCLKTYEFPQAALRDRNRNFTYRVVGPFSVPDYGRGSYGALLTLRVLKHFSGSSSEMSFSTAMSMSFDNLNREADFVAWLGNDNFARDYRSPPRLFIGEAKSLGRGELITARDIANLKSIAAKLPESVVVISVMRDHFTRLEKKLLKGFVSWGRRVNIHGEPTNPVLLLTANELTMDQYLSWTWNELGGMHRRHADRIHNVLELADATQQIYLGLPSFNQARSEYWQRRLARREAMQSQ